jgi:hypothetical protein
MITTDCRDGDYEAEPTCGYTYDVASGVSCKSFMDELFLDCCLHFGFRHFRYLLYSGAMTSFK